MPETLRITINGMPSQVHEGTTVAAAMLRAGQPSRISVEGFARAPLCGMGICFECRAIVNGTPHSRSCQILCADGMAVETSQ